MIIDTIRDEIAGIARIFGNKDCQFRASKTILGRAKLQINQGNFEDAVALLKIARDSAGKEEKLVEDLRILKKSLKEKRELGPIQDSLQAGDIDGAVEALRQTAQTSASAMEKDLQALHADGVVVGVSADHIVELIAGGKYRDALIEAEMIRSKVSACRGVHAKASALRKTITSPDLLALYDAGQYEEFIRRGEHMVELTEAVRKTLADAERFGTVPDEIRALLTSPARSDLEETVSRLRTFLTTARPRLTVQFDRTRLNAGEWVRTHLMITNTGDAHAFETYVTLSEDFETKRITPVTVRAGATVPLEFGVRPRTKGEIPFEISLHCTDGNGKKYDHLEEFWIEVTDISMATTPRSQTGSGPVVSELSGRYLEWTFLGKGGFARVYRAKKKDGSEVAVKVPISLDESTGKSFLNEIQNWTSLDHDNIVKVYDYNIMPVPYFEMELCDSSLADADRPMACDEAAWILFNVCEGLKYAHARSIVHRDLKPQNIMLKNGVPKVADWGLSRVMAESTSTTKTSFTPYYASPEQISGGKKDARTDVWQLGVILYELLSGALPFTGENMVEIGMKIATAEPLPPTQITHEAEDLEPVILRCLSKNPDLRYQSIADLQCDLAKYLNMNYAESLKVSIGRDDFSRSAQYCSELMLINLKIGEMGGAYRYATDLSNYVRGDVKEGTRELTDQIRFRMEEGITGIPNELIEKARAIDHKVRVGQSNM